jgi:hypothetical protein
MRSRRLSFVAGWAAVALLAVAGFAAFGTPDRSPDEIRAEAAAASIGHTAGAYAGLNFALLGADGATAAVAVTTQTPSVGEGGDDAAEDDAEATEDSSDQPASGTIASTTSGWLSEIEVRALVEVYFEPQDVNRAVRIAWCESLFDPNATDMRTGGVGLFNHLPQYWDERAENAGFRGADPTDPTASTAAAAWEVYNGAGWEIFTCR